MDNDEEEEESSITFNLPVCDGKLEVKESGDIEVDIVESRFKDD